MLSNPDVQRVLCRVDSQILTKALKDVDIGIREKIFRNMRDDAAAILKEDMEYMGPIRLIDVHEAQYEITRIMRLLEKGEQI